MNKKAICTLLSLGVIITNTGMINANELNSPTLNTEISQEAISDNEVKIKSDYYSFNLPYNKDDINITYKEYENKVEYTVTSKNTGEILTVFGEETIKIEKNIYSEKLGRMATRLSKNLYQNHYKGPCAVRVNQPITIWAQGSFRAIDTAGKPTLTQVSGGDWSMSSTTVKNNWKNGQQSMSITTTAMTTLTVKTTATTVGSFSVSNLRKAGFSVASSDNKNYIARFTPEKYFGFKWDIEKGYTPIY